MLLLVQRVSTLIENASSVLKVAQDTEREYKQQLQRQRKPEVKGDWLTSLTVDEFTRMLDDIHHRARVEVAKEYEPQIKQIEKEIAEDTRVGPTI